MSQRILAFAQTLLTIGSFSALRAAEVVDHPFKGVTCITRTESTPRNVSLYDAIQARTAIGLSRNNRTLFLLTVDRAGGSLGMKVGEVADLLIRDYGVYNALNLDGGGSVTLAMENPVTHVGGIVNVSSDNPKGRPVGSNLAVFAAAAPAPR